MHVLFIPLLGESLHVRTCTSTCSLLFFHRITDSYSSLVLSVLSHLLVDGPVSPFYQSLIDRNIGSEYTPNTGLAKYMYGNTLG